MARIAGINIPQNKIVSIALTYIHGIGLHSSKKICKKLDIPSSKRVNELSEEQVLKITTIITVFGVINIPIIKYSVDWWNTLHQPASIIIFSKYRIKSS